MVDDIPQWVGGQVCVGKSLFGIDKLLFVIL